MRKIRFRDVIKRAWRIYKNGNHSLYSASFSNALGRAWEVEAANVKYEEEQKMSAEYKKWYEENKVFIDNYVYNNLSWVKDNPIQIYNKKKEKIKSFPLHEVIGWTKSNYKDVLNALYYGTLLNNKFYLKKE